MSPEYTGPERRMNDARITKVETRLDGHEDLCAERYRNLEHAIAGGKRL